MITHDDYRKIINNYCERIRYNSINDLNIAEIDISDLEKFTKLFLDKCCIRDIIGSIDRHYTLFDDLIKLYELLDNRIYRRTFPENYERPFNNQIEIVINSISLFLKYYEENNMITEIFRYFRNIEDNSLPLLTYIVSQGFYDLIKLLIAFFERNNLTDSICTQFNENLLHMACNIYPQSGHTYHHIKYIIDYFNLNGLHDMIIQPCIIGKTAFHYACEYRTLSEIKLFTSYFIENKLYQEFTRTDNHNCNPFSHIISNKDPSTILHYLDIIEEYNIDKNILLSKYHCHSGIYRYSICYIHVFGKEKHSECYKKIYDKILDIICKSNQKMYLIDKILNIQSDKISSYFLKNIIEIKNSSIKATEDYSE